MKQFHDGRITLHHGDCREILASLSSCSIDACVTDPPYHLTAGKKGASGEASINLQSPAGRARITTGFMGKQWDGGDVAFTPELWAEVLRLLKPGAHLVAFGGTRTYHRMACAIEDAGFEIRDQIGWAYGSGFPKSHDVSKGIDKAAGADREVVGVKRAGLARKARAGAEMCGGEPSFEHLRRAEISAPATDDARQWEGWGTALKPAWEPICLARKPLSEATVAANVLRWGTGALNIDGCRIEGESTIRNNHGGTGSPEQWRTGNGGDFTSGSPRGRWPANLCHDGSEEVLAAFPDAPGQQAAISLNAPSAKTGNVYGKMNRRGEKSADSRYHDKGATGFAALPGMRRADSGSAARFFYTAKADAGDRLGSKHPTVKPVDLMQWLCRLVTPPGGTVLDCFAGTGTTGEAAFREGFRAILIEREAEYCADIERRMDLLLASKAERRRAASRASPDTDLPLLSASEF